MIFGLASSVCTLFLIATGALYSEYAGRLALFLDAVINLSAFLFFTFVSISGNTVFAFFAALAISSAVVYVSALIIFKS